MRHTILKAILVTAAAFSAGAAGAAMFANVHVEPGREVLLGQNEHGAFSISGQNIGEVAIEVAARRADGPDRRLARIEPGARVDQDFNRGESAVLHNSAIDQDAVLMLRVHGDGHGTAGHGVRAEP